VLHCETASARYGVRVQSLPGLPRNRALKSRSGKELPIGYILSLAKSQIVSILYFRLIPLASNYYETTRVGLVSASVT
jgi:hypothetical protein